MKPIIMVVEDDPALNAAVKFCLEMSDYKAVTASDGEEALFLLKRTTPDLIITDISMPWMDGVTFYKRLQEDPRWVDLPVIFLTGVDDWSTLLDVKSLGADDYLSKPFKPDELLASVKGRLRRATQHRSGTSIPDTKRIKEGKETIEVGDVLIDPKTYRVQRGNSYIELTRTEFDLLLCLAQRAGQVLSPEEIIRSVFQDELALYDTGDRVRVHIKNLRRKLEPDPTRPSYIQNVRGVGYMFATPAYQE